MDFIWLVVEQFVKAHVSLPLYYVFETHSFLSPPPQVYEDYIFLNMVTDVSAVHLAANGTQSTNKFAYKMQLYSFTGLRDEIWFIQVCVLLCVYCLMVVSTTATVLKFMEA